MKVRDLIAILQGFDPDLPVIHNHDLGANMMHEDHARIGYYRPDHSCANAIDEDFYSWQDDEEKQKYVKGLIL